MKLTFLTLVLLATIGFAAGDAAVVPQSSASPKPSATSLGIEAIAIPQMLSYQGRLTDTTGIPVPNGSYSVVFRLYTTASGGSPFWNETQSVATEEGLFAVLLGSVTPIGSMPDAGAAYLAMAVEGGAELTPRFRLVSTAYSYLSDRAANADLVQGKDTSALDARYVNEAQPNSVTGAMLVDGTVQTADVADTAVTMAKIARAGASTGQVVKWTGSAWAPGQDNTGGGSGVTNVYQDTGIVCVPNPITTTGNVKLDLSFGDSRYVNEAQANSITGAMITDGNVTSADIRDTTVNTAELKDASVTAAKLNQMGATTNQVLKWTGSAWAPRNDSIGTGGMGDSVPGSFAVTNDLRVYGKGRIGPYNSNAGTAAFVAGYSGAADGNYSSVTGGYSNTASGPYAHVGGGNENVAGDTFAAVGGGLENSAGKPYAFVGGGLSNSAAGYATVIAGGEGNKTATFNTAIGGGLSNVITSAGSGGVIAGGRVDTVSAAYAAVAGGQYNTAGADNAFVGGGYANKARGSAATVAGGSNNTTAGYSAAALSGYSNIGGDAAADTAACVAGGYDNSATVPYAFVGGGYRNDATGPYATIAGGGNNDAAGYLGAALSGGSNIGGDYANDTAACVAGGYDNQAYAAFSFVGGGYGNQAMGKYSLVGGGRNCWTAGPSSGVLSGNTNQAGAYSSDTGACVAGGYNNNAGDPYVFIGGGNNNAASGKYATVGGGARDTADALYGGVFSGYSNLAGDSLIDTAACVAGGYDNSATASFSFVGGGLENDAPGRAAVVSGGGYNTASGFWSTVAGGYGNTASGFGATVAGGERNAARGASSLAAGYYARANHNGSFVWGDSTLVNNDTVYTTGVNQFRVRARGGTWFFSNAGMTTGAYLAPNSNSWESACDSMTKEDFRSVDRKALLERVSSLRVRDYKMKDQNDGTRHIGPVAQDFYAAFGYGGTETGINLADADGVALAAIQALHEDNKVLRAEIEALKAELKRR